MHKNELTPNAMFYKTTCVLIYDDDEEILSVCKAILSRYPFRVVTLTRCENVMNDISIIKPDIILMDLWIPEIGGDKAVVLIKEDPNTCHIPIILFSANINIKDICFRIGANDYIEKPFSLTRFTETIEQNILKFAVQS